MSGKLRWPHPPYGHLQQKSESFEGWNNFDIMETDYVNYAVMYQCQTRWLGASTFEKMWVLVRQPTPIDSNLWREYKRVAFQAISRGFINTTIGQQYATEKVMLRKKQGGSFCNYPSDPVADKINNGDGHMVNEEPHEAEGGKDIQNPHDYNRQQSFAVGPESNTLVEVPPLETDINETP